MAAQRKTWEVLTLNKGEEDVAFEVPAEIVPLADGEILVAELCTGNLWHMSALGEPLPALTDGIVNIPSTVRGCTKRKKELFSTPSSPASHSTEQSHFLG